MNARLMISKSAAAGNRRSNTIVLVIGILVLLVIIATAFVVRTQAGRVTSTAQKDAGLHDDDVRAVADDLAGELSTALFVRPINFGALGTPLNLHVGSNASRLTLSPNAIRFLGDEQDNDGNSRPDYPYNLPSYIVTPYTNWPDPATLPNNGGAFGGNGAIGDWPAGPGNPTASFSSPSPLAAEFNPLGDPGFGDFRALRDLEPLRWDTNNDGIPDAYSHWRHMSNISRPDNGWRIVYDISDVGDSNNDGYGRLVTDLNVPVEQFLAIPHAYLNSATGDTNLVPLGIGTALNNDFINHWGNWLGVSPGGIGEYINAYQDPNLIPPNLVRLRDINANGVALEDGERPQDEFAGPGINPAFATGAPRWQVGRILADTDGDGYTDSFWFLAPSPVQAGVRTLVAVSVIDNQGMLDANVALRFIRTDTTPTPQETRGLTPTDLALVGQGAPQQYGSAASGTNVGNFDVGLYDNWDNWLSPTLPPVSSDVPAQEQPNEYNVSYDVDLASAGNLWFRHLTEVGLTNAANAPLAFPNTATRLDYWRRSASRPLSADPQSRYTPFTLSDELEMRMYSGQNYPWVVSRLELSASNDANASGFGPYRGNVNREESSEFINQARNRIQVRDIRHRTTVYNGARNDIAPPWLWLYGPNKDRNGDAIVNALDRDLDGDGNIGDLDDILLFQAGARKFDLRMPYDQAGYAVSLAGEWNALPGYEFTANTTALQYGIALRDRIANSLIDAFDNLPSNRGTYYGNTLADVDRTLELAAAYAANIAQWRDRETPAVAGDVTSHELSRLTEAVPVVPGPTVAAPTARFLGMEPQPFIVEAYIGHVYGDAFGAIPPTDGAGNPYTNAGQHVVVEEDSTRSTIVVVQIANPYARPINLDDPDAQFQVRVFGQEFDLAGLGTLAPASEDRPSTMVLYAIKDDITAGTGLQGNWVDFLDITNSDLPPDSQIIRVDTSRWDIDSRSTYDTSTEPAVDIRRRDPAGQWVTIDRLDPPASRRFGDAVNQLALTAPPAPAPLPPATWIHGDPAGQPYPGYNIGIDGSLFDNWIQWVRATRAWGVDVDDDGEMDFNEVNPRFVFGDYAVCSAAGDPADVADIANTATFVYGGNRYRFTASPDSPWFTRPFTREDPTTPGVDQIIATRKPTFFDFNHQTVGVNGGDPAYPQWSFPDKGWYDQKGTGTPDDAVIDTSTAPVTRSYRTPFAFQMLQKDGDFEQVGELLNVFLYGHKVQFTDNTPTGTFTGVTLTTFSEYLSEPQDSLTGYQDPNLRYRINRLLLTPTSNGGTMGQFVGVGDPAAVDDPRHAIPDMPAGVRLLEAFVCDGFGCEPLVDLNGSGSTIDEAEDRTLYNAKGFDGSSTPGLININTAPLEVIRCLPHMMRLVHETGGVSAAQPYYNAAGEPLVTTAPNPAAHDPRVMLPESIIQFREGYNGDGTAPIPTGFVGGPNYEQRFCARGIDSIGELLLLNNDGQASFLNRATNNGVDTIYPEQWRADLGVEKRSMQVGGAATAKPFYEDATVTDQISMLVSTDRQNVWNPTTGATRPDYVAGDVEEANALFAGISNMITTRSDVFTVYFKVRTFRQNTSVNPPRWDATNSEYIIDDSRYVMLVDRSGVNQPGDQPKILYMEKLPN